jgi:acyl-CoA reductase-like NAD-dependent aldehyde dehydrogenase
MAGHHSTNGSDRDKNSRGAHSQGNVSTVKTVGAHAIQPLGADWPESNLIWGARGGHGEIMEQTSPVDRSVIQRVGAIDERELSLLLQPKPTLILDHNELWRFTERLHGVLSEIRAELIEAMRWETAFTLADCEEVTQGSLDYVHDFRRSLQSIRRPLVTPVHYEVPNADGVLSRRIRMVSSPWGTIAAILPQSAFLITGITCLLNALAAGNRIILRVPLQAARTAALLAYAVEAARPPYETVSIVQIKSREFVSAINRSPMPYLIHYMGSSRYAPDIHSDAFQHGNSAIIDGEGNTWIWVAEDADIESAAQLLTQGATRYNGQTCTSINGAMIHPTIYADLKACLVEKWRALKAGNPIADESVHVGPLLDELQGEWCERRIQESGGTILCGGQRDKNLFEATLVESPDADSAFVTDGIFGSAMWIAPGDQDIFVQWWPKNRFPLCAGVLSPAVDLHWWLPRLPNLARLTVNSDPTVEHIYEPWGGYPESGLNPVGTWKEKYQRVVAIDEPSPK